MSLAACAELTEINLPHRRHATRWSVQRCSTLLASISSPHLQKITIAFDKGMSFSDSLVVTSLLSHEEWKTFEDTFLGLSSRGENLLEVVIISPMVGRVRVVADWDTLLPRFSEVGKVRFEFPCVGA